MVKKNVADLHSSACTFCPNLSLIYKDTLNSSYEMSLINPQYLCHVSTCTTVVLLSFMRHRQEEIAFQTRNSVMPESDVIVRFTTRIICTNCEDSSSFPRLSLRRAGVVGGGGACACVFLAVAETRKLLGRSRTQPRGAISCQIVRRRDRECSSDFLHC